MYFKILQFTNLLDMSQKEEEEVADGQTALFIIGICL